MQVRPGAGAHLGVAGVGGAAPVQGDPGPRVVGVQAAVAGSVLGPGPPWVTIQPDEQLGQLPQLRVGEAAAAPAPAALLVVVWAAVAVLAALRVALARQTRVIALHTALSCKRTEFYSEKAPTEPSPCGKRPLVRSHI